MFCSVIQKIYDERTDTLKPWDQGWEFQTKDATVSVQIFGYHWILTITLSLTRNMYMHTYTYIIEGES